jgi:hypothetical protein
LGRAGRLGVSLSISDGGSCGNLGTLIKLVRYLKFEHS